MILYHGTSSGRLDSILKHGLVPRGAVPDAKGNWEGWRESKELVYLSETFPAFYAAQSCGKDEDGVILRVDVDDDALVPDEDFLCRALLSKGAYASLEEAHRKVDPVLYRRHWRDSLSWLGTVATPRVPPERILGHRVISDVWELMRLGGDQVIQPITYRLLAPRFRAALEELFAREAA